MKREVFMTLDILVNDMNAARKAADKQRVTALSNMIDAVKKASMTPKGRVEITEKLVDETLIKYQKIVQEQYDTCPCHPDYMIRRNQYCTELEIVKEYAPQLINDLETVKTMILATVEEHDISLTKNNKGLVMKTIVPLFKGKADMSIVSKVVGELLV